MKKAKPESLLHILQILLFVHVSPLSAAVFYVDSSTGNDLNAGTSSNSAWRTLGKVNGTTFLPGDVILFKADESWIGSLNPKGSGVPNQPIIIDQYGSGDKPLIDGNGTSGAGTTGGGAVYLFNQEWWEINNLEIINDAAFDAERRGIHIAASNFGTLNHIHIKNCYIHNVRGRLSSNDGDLVAKRTGGIIVETIDDSSVPTRFNDVLIESNIITTVRNQGIVAAANRSKQNDYPLTAAWNARRASNLTIRNNTISDVTKNALILRLADSTCLVEWNVCHNTATLDTGNTMFTASCNGSVFQYNEGYENKGGPLGSHDGSLYDADLRSTDIIFQYSYSHDNAHGLFWNYPSSSGPNSNIVVRYNVSRNDRGNIFSFSGDSGAEATTYIYNNTVYLPPGSDNRIFDARGGTHTFYAYNNIFFIESADVSYDFGSNIQFFNFNTFFGEHPAGEPYDPNKLTADPLLAAPGTGAAGIGTLAGYQLLPGSPCIDSGMNIGDNGGWDFFGNPVPFNSTADRGVHEFVGAAPPIFISDPHSQVVMAGGNVQISAVAVGAEPLDYQWRKFGVIIPDATNSVLSWSGVTLGDAGSYDIVSANDYGTATSAVAVLTVFSDLLATNLSVATEAFVRGGASADVDQDEGATGYLFVKYNTGALDYARKAYFQFDLAGLDVYPDSEAVLSVTTHSTTSAHRAQLWGLNEAYANFSPNITWNNAQANDTASNNLLTSGMKTATPIGGSVFFDGSTSATYDFTIARIGDFMKDGRVSLALSGVDDPGNDNGGLRLALGSARLLVQTVVMPVSTNPPSVVAIEPNPDHTVSMDFLGTAGITYRLQAATNLTAPTWVGVSTNTAPADGSWTVTDFSSTNLPVRFYRLLTP